jgi:hypothetical protein
MPDRNDRGIRQFLFNQPVERGLRGFIEGSGRLVEKQVFRGVQQRPRKPKALLFAEREHSVPMRLLVQPLRKLDEPDRDHGVPDPIRTDRVGRCGIGYRVLERPDRKIRSLRQHHQHGAGGNSN